MFLEIPETLRSPEKGKGNGKGEDEGAFEEAAGSGIRAEISEAYSTEDVLRLFRLEQGSDGGELDVVV